MESPSIYPLGRPRRFRSAIGGIPTLHLLEIEDKLFRTNSAVVLPEAEDPSDDTVESRRSSAVGIIASCLRFCSEHPGYKILVAGHTDTAGNLTYNAELSCARAEAVLAVLTGDSKRFAEICIQRRFMTNDDYNQILAWASDTWGWDCHPGAINSAGNDLVVNEFRKEYNAKGPGATWAKPIKEYGGAGTEEVWEAYFNCYEDFLAEELGVDRDGLQQIRSELVFAYDRGWVGCNEHHPRQAANLDDYPCGSNRRVEIMFFDPLDEIPAVGCIPDTAGCDKTLCPLFDLEEFVRIILPPMVSAKAWRAEWENESEPAGADFSKEMILYAPGLPGGMLVTFKVFAMVDDGPPMEIDIISIFSAENRVQCPFSSWFSEDYVTDLGIVDSLSELPQVRFYFEAAIAGRRVVSKSIAYSDSVSMKFFEDDAHSKVVSGADYKIFSPWFQYRGVVDGSGAVAHDGLPPGGAFVALAEHVTSVPVSDGTVARDGTAERQGGPAIFIVDKNMNITDEPRFGTWDYAWNGCQVEKNDTPNDKFFIDTDEYCFSVRIDDVMNEYTTANQLQINVQSYEYPGSPTPATNQDLFVTRVSGTETFLSDKMILVADRRDLVHLPSSKKHLVFLSGIFGYIKVELLNPVSETMTRVVYIWKEINIKNIEVQIMVLKNRYAPDCKKQEEKLDIAAKQFINARNVYARMGINLIPIERKYFKPNQYVEKKRVDGVEPIYVVHVPHDEGLKKNQVDCCTLGRDQDNHGKVCEWYPREGNSVRMFVSYDLGGVNGTSYATKYNPVLKAGSHYNDAFFLGRPTSEKEENSSKKPEEWFTCPHEIGHLLSGDAQHVGEDELNHEYMLMRTHTRPDNNCTASKWVTVSKIKDWRDANNHNLF